MADEIVVRVPATTGHIGLLRATATALAARLDFTYDRLTDLHIAIDEVCGRILATSDPQARHLEARFVVQDDDVTVTLTGDGKLKPGAEFMNPWSKIILESIAGDVDVSERDGSVVAAFHVGGTG